MCALSYKQEEMRHIHNGLIEIDLWGDNNDCNSESDIFQGSKFKAPLNHCRAQQIFLTCSVHSDSLFKSHTCPAEVPMLPAAPRSSSVCVNTDRGVSAAQLYHG